MSGSALGARQRLQSPESTRGTPPPTQPSLVKLATLSPSAGTSGASLVTLDGALRLSLVLTPQGRGRFRDQAQELLETARGIAGAQSHPMAFTCQTVFLRDAADQPECERIFAKEHGAQPPLTNYVFQPPCCGAAVALESWAVGGPGVRLEHPGSRLLVVRHGGLRWVYCSGISVAGGGSVYAQATTALEQLQSALLSAGSSLEHVVRTWFYLGEITGPDGPCQRYKELNRARTDFYRAVPFHAALLKAGRNRAAVYPASTGIGMNGRGLVLSCAALQTDRPDAQLVPLENPLQTPAFSYPSRYSPESPKFSRAMALVLESEVVTWVSGTASIVDAESRYPAISKSRPNRRSTTSSDSLPGITSRRQASREPEPASRTSPK